VVLWITEAIPMAMTAFLGVAAAVALGIAPAQKAFAPFADPLIFVFIGTFMLARAIFFHGLDRRFAFAMLALPGVGARPARVLAVFALIGCLISMWISNTATVAMLYPIALSLLAVLESHGDGTKRYAAALLLAASFAASVGGLGTPVGTPPNLIGIGFIRRELGIDLPFFSWMMLGVPISLLLLGVAVVGLNRGAPATAGAALAARIDAEHATMGPWTIGQVNAWKAARDMVTEGCPFVPAACADPAQFDPWSARNMRLSPDGGVTPAPRTTGDRQAIAASYRSGLVFTGDIDIPVIDWRHYLEDQLNMHNSHQSFASRKRMLDHDGRAGNQVIWFTDARPAVAFDQTPEALAVMDQWMANIRANPARGVVGNKPALAVDRCFDTSGAQIAAGPDVWAGILDHRPAGACTQKFPLYGTSRTVAGGPIEGGVFACDRQSVAAAIARGLYGSWRPSAQERARLQQIFPTGVCRY